MRARLHIALIAAALAAAPAALAQSIPQTFTFTARVSNADGPLTGTHQIILRMYDARTAGTKLWEESHIDVPVTDGLVTLAMGSETAITNADLTDAGVWVEVVVDGSTLAPRIQLRAVPYARRSQDTLRLGGQAPAYYATAAHNHDADYVNVSGDSMTSTLWINGGGLYSQSTGGIYSHIPYWGNGWNYLSGNGTLFRDGTAGNEYGRINDAGTASFNNIWLYANPDDCPQGWTCNGRFWDISLLSVYYNGLVQRSDRRLKKNIRSIGTGLDLVSKLRPVTYEWKDPKQKGTHYGFIAQEVEEVIPDLVTVNDKGFKALETTGILPVAVRAIQEMKAENDKLKTDVDRLAGMVEQQQREIDALKAGHPLPPRGSKTALRWVAPVSLGGGVLVFAFGLVATFRRRRSDPAA